MATKSRQTVDNVVPKFTVCDSCGKQFSNVYTLNAHKKQVHEHRRPFNCKNCNLSFATKYKLQRHEKGIHSEERNMNCEICGNAFKTREMLLKHHRIHFKGPFSCEVCKEIFKYKAGRDHHYKLKHQTKEASELKQTAAKKQQRQYECMICNKTYKSLKSLQKHIAGSHEDMKIKSSSEEKLMCYLCLKQFQQRHEFESHIASHEEDYKYEDIVVVEEILETEIKCTKNKDRIYDEIKKENTIEPVVIQQDEVNVNDNYQEFLHGENVEIVEEYEQYMIVKEESESNEQILKETQKSLEKIICDSCGVFFQSKSHLRRHNARKHQNKAGYKFECDVCSSKFLLRYDLQRHMIKHNSTRDIECSMCGKKFKTKASLDIHIKVIHDEKRANMEKCHSCHICNRSYFHKRHLDYHMRKHTNDRRYKCDKCEKKFLYSDAVKWHQIRAHKDHAPFVCTLCSRKFIHEKTFNSHMKEHEPNSGSLAVSCPICSKKISEKRHLPRHIRTHLKKGFTCQKCNESFKERFQLSKHLISCENKDDTNVEIIYETIIE